MLGGLAGGVELLLLGAALLPLGELLRGALATRIPILRLDDPPERALVDFYLGGAALYLLALSPFPGFNAVSVVVLVVGGAAGVALLRAKDWIRYARSRWSPSSTLSVGPMVVVAASALGLLLLESAIAGRASAGNTFDSSVLDLYVALLLSHGHLTFSLAPVAVQAVVVPQGSTVLYAFGQLLLSPPPTLAPLLLTPWFIALSPVGAYALARRWGAGPWGSATTAVGFAVLGSWTRVLVSGSYDFVAAFPLVLLLLGWSVGTRGWSDAGHAPWANAVGFGLVAGISAAINPVGAQLVFLGLPVWMVLRGPLDGRGLVRWLSRWMAAVGLALLFVVPSLGVLWTGRASPGLVPGAGALYSAGGTGLGLPTVIAALDPFLIGPADVRLSPFPVLRIELIVLLALALFWLVVLRRSTRVSPPFGPYRVGVLASLAASLVLLGALWLGAPQASVLHWTGVVTSADQLGVLLFAVYTALALAPLGALVARARSRPEGPSQAESESSRSADPPRSWSGRSRAGLQRPWLSGAVGVLLMVPGVAVTATQLPANLADEYQAFGTVSAADFQAVDWMAVHLPPGARLLVAPGSSAEFVTAEDPHLVLLFPMTPVSANRTYTDLVSHLVRGDLSGNASVDLRTLGVQFIAVTGQNNRLFPAFSTAPLLGSPSFAVLFQSGDATVFGVVK